MDSYNETSESFRIEKLKNSNFVPKSCRSTVWVFTILFEMMRVGISLTSIFSIIVFTTQICLENDDSPQTMFKLSLAISDMFTGLVGVSAGLIRCYNDLYKMHRIVAFGFVNTYEFQKLAARYFGTIHHCCFSAGLYNMAFSAYDRTLAIKDPLKYRIYRLVF